MDQEGYWRGQEPYGGGRGMPAGDRIGGGVTQRGPTITTFPEDKGGGASASAKSCVISPPLPRTSWRVKGVGVGVDVLWGKVSAASTSIVTPDQPPGGVTETPTPTPTTAHATTVNGTNVSGSKSPPAFTSLPSLPLFYAQTTVSALPEFVSLVHTPPKSFCNRET